MKRLEVVLLIAVFVSVISSNLYAGPRATVVDRLGNRFEVSNLEYYGGQSFDFITRDGRKRLKFEKMKKIQFMGERNDEQQTVVITLPDGKTISATKFVGSSDRYTGGGSGTRALGSAMYLSGQTKLGKFELNLRDTKEIIIHHYKLVRKCPVDNRTFRQEGYRFCPYHGDRLEEIEQKEGKAKSSEVESKSDKK